MAKQQHTRRARAPDGLLSMVVLLPIMVGWLLVFTIGSQLPSSGQPNLLMQWLTKQEPNTILLGLLASWLGVWRRRSHETSPEPARVDYVSGLVSGFISAIVVRAFPPGVAATAKILLGDQGTFQADQNTYCMFALVTSLVAFISGYDRNVFDRLVGRLMERLGLAAPPVKKAGAAVGTPTG